MGVAAYQRGSAVVSRQIDEEAKRNRLVSIDQYDLQAIEDDRSRLREENDRLTRESERLWSHLRERRLTLRMERESSLERLDKMKARVHGAERAMLMYRRRWEWVSRLLRQACSPEQVRQAREEMKEEGRP